MIYLLALAVSTSFSTTLSCTKLNENLEAVAARSANIDRLIKNADKHLKNNAVNDAAASIEALGLYRATESVPLLVKYIDFTPLGIVAGRPYRLSESRPCVYALGKIGGRECHDAVLNLVAKSGDQDSISYTKVVLTMSLGHDDAVAMIQNRAGREKDKVKASHLRALAKSIEEDSHDTTYDD